MDPRPNRHQLTRRGLRITRFRLCRELALSVTPRSPRQTLRRLAPEEGTNFYCNPEKPENKLNYKLFNAPCQEESPTLRRAFRRTEARLVHLHGLEPGTH